MSSIKLTKESSALKLTKENGAHMSAIKMGLGWDQKSNSSQEKASGFFGKLFGSSAPSNTGSERAIDLDASVLVFDKNKNHLETIYFGRLTGMAGAVVHSGDNRTGAGKGDDEVISVDLAQISASAHSLVFVVNSFTGQKFTEIANAYCRVIDVDNNKEHSRFDLSGGTDTTGYLMSRVNRVGTGWEVKALGVPCSGRTARDLEAIASSYAG